MVEAAGMGFRAQIREILSHEPVVLVPISERNVSRFDRTLTDLGQRSQSEDGMLNINKLPEESNKEWMESVKGLWVFGPREANLAVPEQAVGFVNAYAPEHFEEMNTWLTAAKKRPYEVPAVLEVASYAKDYPQHLAEESSALKQAITKVFMDEPFKDVRAVSIWVTHDAQNKLDPLDAEQMIKLGGTALGALRYDAKESVDSTCFIIPRKAFLDKLTAPKK